MRPSDLSQEQLSQLGFLSQLRHDNFIDGQPCPSRSSATTQVIDPATEMVVAEVPDSNAEDVNLAVASARRALHSPAWANMLPAERERLLYRLSVLIEEHGDELSALETLQSGKLRGIARMVDVAGGAALVRYMAGWATKLEGQTLQPSLAGPGDVQYRSFTQREPIGVVAAIVPWNFPLAIALWKMAPALAAGCTVVLKPSEETPLTALRLAQLVQQAGFPAGVFNVVCGRGHSAGAALASHPGIDKVSFTGSTAVGKAIGHAAVDHMTRMTLELGGKSPMIVLPDADVQQVAQGAAMGIFFNQGQVCTAASRLYIHRSLFEPVVQALAEIAAGMKIGSGFDAASQLGPVVSKRHFERVMQHIEAARQAGARIVTGGEPALGGGYFIRPTVLTEVHADMAIVREEVFGPVIVALPYDDIDEVVALANDSPYGLAASIWSHNLSAVHRLIPRIKAGTVWVNTHNMLDMALPLGGFKQSGYGHDLGRAAVESYTTLKSVCMAI